MFLQGAPPTTRTHEHGAPPPHDGVPHPIDRELASYAFTAEAPLCTGHCIGRYVIEKEIGRGGMGIVFAAIDGDLGRRVALKIVLRRTKSGKLIHRSRERLLREAQALARISHRSIVQLYEIGESEYGLYLAMEYLEGDSLRHWLAERERGWREVVDVFVAAGRGLATAHGAGLVHRDFKPNNVHIGRDGRIAVLDFGLARAAPDKIDGSPILRTDQPTPNCPVLYTRLTDVGMVLGTAGYMAPEQLLTGTVGPWSDQFSFCVALFEALYGHRPYPGRNAVELAIAFRNGELTIPAGGVPRHIRSLLRRGLAIDPKQRHPSMAALIDALAADPRRAWRRAAGMAALVATASVSAWVTVSAHGAWKLRSPARACAVPSVSAAATEPDRASGADRSPVILRDGEPLETP